MQEVPRWGCLTGWFYYSVHSRLIRSQSALANATSSELFYIEFSCQQCGYQGAQRFDGLQYLIVIDMDIESASTAVIKRCGESMVCRAQNTRFGVLERFPVFVSLSVAGNCQTTLLRIMTAMYRRRRTRGRRERHILWER